MTSLDELIAKAQELVEVAQSTTYSVEWANPEPSETLGNKVARSIHFTVDTPSQKREYLYDVIVSKRHYLDRGDTRTLVVAHLITDYLDLFSALSEELEQDPGLKEGLAEAQNTLRAITSSPSSPIHILSEYDREQRGYMLIPNLCDDRLRERLLARKFGVITPKKEKSAKKKQR